MIEIIYFKSGEFSHINKNFIIYYDPYGTTHVLRYTHEASHPVHATTLREIFVLL